MGQAVHIEKEFPSAGGEEARFAELSQHDMADYACGLLGPLQKLMCQKEFALLAHLTKLAYAEACWLRSQSNQSE